MAAAPPPELPDDLVQEILLRIPPDDPALVLRASLACKTWSRAVSRPGSRRRLHDLHGAPPVLGFFNDWDDEDIPRFIPATASPFSLAVPDRRLWRTVDCRHGRALFLGQDTQELLVWEPITGDQKRVPVAAAAFESRGSTAAVFCAVDGCDHRDCLGGPFCVVFISSIAEEHVTSACVYSSETGAWSDPTLWHDEFNTYFTLFSSVLVGRSLLYFMSNCGLIMEYDLARHVLSAFDPPYPDDFTYDHSFNLLLAEDGGLGLTQELNPHLKLWSREVVTAARWVPGRIIYLGSLFHNGGLMDAYCGVKVLGFAEGANVIFVTAATGLFTVELQSDRVTKVCDDHGFCNLVPVVSFYTPMPPGFHRMEKLPRSLQTWMPLLYTKLKREVPEIERTENQALAKIIINEEVPLQSVEMKLRIQEVTCSNVYDDPPLER